MPSPTTIKKLQDMGFNLMPLRQESKLPIQGVSWEHLKTNRYRGTFPESCNVAVLCGEISGGLFVVDCDHATLYDDLQEYHGKTRIIKSGKGYHFYFRSSTFCPPGKKFTDNKLRHIDVKSEGGYVVSEESVHPDTKKQYECICDVPPLTIDPQVIKDKLLKLNFNVNKHDIQEIAKGVLEGGRDDATFAYACHMIREGLFGEALRKVVNDLNEKHTPPLPDTDVTRIINSAIKYEGKRIPQTLRDITRAKKDTGEPIDVPMQKITPVYEGVPIRFNAMIIAVGERMTYTKEADYICVECEAEGKPPRTQTCDTYHKISAPLCVKHKKPCVIDVSTMKTGYIQQLRIQEFLEDARNSSPVQFDCEILDDSVGEAYTSDRKSFVGKFRSIPTKTGYNQIVFEILEMCDVSQREGCLPTKQELQKWQGIPDLFEQIRDSIAPELLINPRIIESLILFGAGGTALNGKRSSIHLGLLGDAQLGKSDLLKRMHEILLGSGYTVGRNTSGAGLTISMVKMYNGTSVAQAGLLPQHTGHEVIIDEGDKMKPEDQNSILDCMEQETSSLSKSGAIGITLPAKCPILFAGNPKGGKYVDVGKSVLDNFNMETPFVSRFDLIWLVIDENNPETDKAIRQHIRGYRNKPAKFSMEELQRYFSYIKTLSPTVPDSIEDKIDKLHAKMRPLNKLESMPIGIRQFHGIYRLVTACASAHLRTEATVQDFEIVLGILESALKSMKMDLSSGEMEGSVLKTKDTKDSTFLFIWNACKDINNEVDKEILIDELQKSGKFGDATKEFDKRLAGGQIELRNSTGRYKMI